MLMTLNPDTKTAHGFSFTTSTIPDEADWRYDAMNRILRNASEDGTPMYLLFEMLREHAPGASVHTFYQDRTDVRRTLARICTTRALFESPVEHTDDTADFIEPRPVYGWWECMPEGADETLELFALPNMNDSGYFVLWGASADTCKTFIERLHKEMHAVHHRCRRYLGSWKDDPELDAEAKKVSWDDIVLPPDQLTDIRATIDQFFTSKEAFRTVGFPWRECR